MSSNRQWYMRALMVAIVAAIGATPSCANSLDLGLPIDNADSGSSTPTFTPPPSDAGDAGDADASVAIPMCVATECPYPFATCPSTAPGVPTYSCEVNLFTDNENCGECGHACVLFEPLAVSTMCMNGICVVRCRTDGDVSERRLDCNGIPDDGCEAFIKRDTQNCGACGNVCAPGEPCIDGLCGCPAGTIYCDGKCIDPLRNPKHCGACSNECKIPVGAPIPRPELKIEYTCVDGVCGKIDCTRGTPFSDCNGDISQWQTPSSDGCEADLSREANCGACGHACDPGQRCELIDSQEGRYECRCRANETKCGEDMGLGPDDFRCADLMTDTWNCGACNYKCPHGPHRVTSCRQGLCQTECEPGFGDCNGVPSDGCEANLSKNPLNCGACGNSCDVDAGQPCIDGTCLTRACDDDAGAVPR